MLLRRYVHGPGVDEPIVWYEGAGTADRRWLHGDERGSIVAESNLGTGTTAYSYGPWGEPGGSGGSRFRYTGQILLPELGLYHYRARTYSPRLGRFLQADPIGYTQGPNLYAYVLNDPVNATDPSGMVTELDTLITQVLNDIDQLLRELEALGETIVVTGRPRDNVGLEGAGIGFDRSGGNQGGGGGGEGPQKDNGKKKSTCDLVADQPGKVFVDFGSVSFVPGLGGSGSIGVFKNLSTGSGGFFYTVGGNLGFEAGAGLSGGFYRSAADLRGLNANVNVSAVVSGSANFSTSGRLVGASLGQSGKLGGSASLSNTTFFGCNYNGN